MNEEELIQWLLSQELFPKVFWREKGSDVSYGAVGARRWFSEVPEAADVRIYGGMCFGEGSGEKDPCWEGFPGRAFWIPQYEMRAEGELLCTQRAEMPRCVQVEDCPAFDAWERGVRSVTHALGQGALEKVVLARRRTLQMQAPLCGWEMLRNLAETTTDATVFAFAMQPGSLFLGASPERLFWREGADLYADALAGTRPRGRNEEEDAHLRRELLASEKERKEFDVVQRFLTAALSEYAVKVAWEGKRHVVTKRHVHHLYRSLHVWLKADTTNAALVAALHPTPALGGFPRQRALEQIRQHEPFERGWYGAPVGVVFPGGAHFAVAIRSGVVDEKRALLHLFSGAGIVEGSDPVLEWEELNHKIKAFGVVHG